MLKYLLLFVTLLLLNACSSTRNGFYRSNKVTSATIYGPLYEAKIGHWHWFYRLDDTNGKDLKIIAYVRNTSSDTQVFRRDMIKLMNESSSLSALNKSSLMARHESLLRRERRNLEQQESLGLFDVALDLTQAVADTNDLDEEKKRKRLEQRRQEEEDIRIQEGRVSKVESERSSLRRLYLEEQVKVRAGDVYHFVVIFRLDEKWYEHNVNLVLNDEYSDPLEFVYYKGKSRSKNL